MATDVGQLFGRDQELVWFVDKVTDTCAGLGAAVVIEGEPGIGKTALAQVVCTGAASRGCQVFQGTGDELARDLPLMPFLDALDISESSVDPERSAIMEILQSATNRSVAELVAAAGERIVSLVDEECSRAPVVLVIDDLQWADRVTVAIWHRLAKLVANLPLLLIGTTRPAGPGEAVAVLREDSAVVQTLELGPLPDTAVAELITMLAGGQPSADLSTMANGAAGNPLYLTELISSLVRDGGLEVSAAGVVDVRASAVPKSLTATIEHRLRFLTGDAHLVLRGAALLGMRFTAADLATALGRRVMDLIPVLDQASVAGVLVESGVRLCFRHPLVRAALYEGMPVTVRAAWHAEVGRALAEGGAPVDDVARQLIAAYDQPTALGSRPERWVLDWMSTNGVVLVGKAPAAAARVLDRLVDPTQPDQNATLVCWLANALYRAGDTNRAEEVCLAAMDTVDDADSLAGLHETLTQCRAMTGRDTESVRDLELALAAPRYAGAASARLRVLLARAHWNLGDLDAADEIAENALEEARAVDDSLSAGWALHVRSIVSICHGQMQEALPMFDEAQDVVRNDPSTTDLQLLLQINRAVTLACLDQGDVAVKAAREAREMADRGGHVVRMAQAQSALGQMLYEYGDWDDALVEVDLLSDELKHPMVACCDHGVAALINLQRGDAETAHRHLVDARSSEQQIGGHVVAQLALAISLDQERAGLPEAALAALRTGPEQGLDAEELLPDIVRLAVETGETEIARDALGRMESLAEDNEVAHRVGAISFAGGLLQEDPERLLHAAEVFSDSGQPLLRAKSCEAAAVVYAEDGKTTKARSAFGKAVELYTSLRADWHVARAQARLRGYGIRRGPQGAHQRASSGWDSLTQAESVVAELVMEGKSNRQIAAQLYLSPRTIATHVSHILGKLRVRTRTDIAREASLRALASR